MSGIPDYLPTINQIKVNNSKKNNIQIKKRLNQFKLPIWCRNSSISNPNYKEKRKREKKKTKIENNIVYLKPTIQEMFKNNLNIKLKFFTPNMVGDVLYKRGFTLPLLICAYEEANYVLQEIHGGVCGNHFGG